MSITILKTPKGAIKGFFVTITRNTETYSKYFPKIQEENAKVYHDTLLKKFPSVQKPKKPRRQTTLHKQKVYKDYIEKNGCVIRRSFNESERCVKSFSCEHYDDCLHQAAKQNWPGFTNQLKGGTP